MNVDKGPMRQARKSGRATKRDRVEEALRPLIRKKRAEQVRALFGQIRWEGDLDASRLGRTFGR